MNRRQHILAGALAGFTATAPMSAAMSIMKKLLPQREQYPLPPHLITMELAERVGVKDDLNQPARAAATMAGHFGYGALAGALYGAVASQVPGPALLKGIAYGLTVWTISYLGWLPLAGMFEQASEQPARRNALMIVAHVVWGAVLGLSKDRLATDRR